jgi:ribosomal protein RSM22 (predicted rRNA methylase)
MNTSALFEAHLAQQILSPRGWAQYQQGDVSHQELLPFVEAIRGLSQAYTEHQPGRTLTRRITTQREALAYALYYAPLNGEKVRRILPLITLPSALARVLDFGCGPGTAALTLLSHTATPLALSCVDSSVEMRQLAQKLLLAAPNRSLQAQLAVTAQIPPGQFDLIMAANVFAELHEDEAERTVATLVAQLAAGGYLLLIEPGQQLHTRRLQRLRDTLLTSWPTLRPLFPCHHAAPCPMLQRSPEDWCHGTLEWEQPPLSRQLDQLLGFNKHRIKFAALLLQRDGALRPGYRVVTPPERTPRGIVTGLCGADFYGAVTLRRGDRSADTKALEKARSFDRIELSLPAASELAAGTTAKRSW